MKNRSIILPAVLCIMLSNSFAQTFTVEDKTKKIEVVGSAEIQVVPDEIYVSITLQEYYDKQKSKIDIDRIQKDFIDRCTKAGISKERIQIQNMSGFDQSNWYWRKRKKEQPDLLASTTYVIKFSQPAEIDKLVNLLDDNATQNVYISKSTHSRMEEYRKEVKIKALQAAKAKAQYLCESIGEKVGHAIYIQEIDGGSAVPMYKGMRSNAMMMDGSAESANEGIDFQKMTIRFEIQAQFAIQ